jgi:hypothetical protein
MNEQEVEKAIRAADRPALHRRVAKAALAVDDIRGDAMCRLVIRLAEDKLMRVFMQRFLSPYTDAGVDLEEAFNEISQLVASVLVAARDC